MFDAIRPYNDAEMMEAMKRVAASPRIDKIASYLGADASELRKSLLSVSRISDFQDNVMLAVLRGVMAKTTTGVTVDGLEYLEKNKSGHCLIISNHRDIVLDPSFLQHILRINGFDFTEIAAGNNLISLRFVADIMRSNRMIIVKRDGTSRELYEASQQLSQYIRNRITAKEGGSSVWIAQRQGRAKDGYDTTEQGLMKMLDMSGTGSFADNFSELSIVPLSISYEYEPCGIRKARELLIKEINGTYTKSEFEDIESVVTGIRQKKGGVHFQFCKPVTADEFAECADLPRNDRYRHLASILDSRILEGYKIWPTSKYAAEMLEGKVPDRAFADYIDAEVASVGGEGLPESALKEKLLKIYAAPMRKM